MNTQTFELQELYETEYDQWLTAMVEHLKHCQFDQLDTENLIEELEALGRSEKSTVKSLLRQIIVHLLLYQFWQSERERNANHWAAEIIAFRLQLDDRLTTNFRNYLADELPNIYQNARLLAQTKTQLKTLPKQCPYSLEELLNKTWLPD